MLERLLAAPEHPVTLAVSRKDRYDDDDMKVIRDGDRLVHVGKKLPLDRGRRGIDRHDDVPGRRAAALPRCDRTRDAHAGSAEAMVSVADRHAGPDAAWSSRSRSRRRDGRKWTARPIWSAPRRPARRGWPSPSAFGARVAGASPTRVRATIARTRSRSATVSTSIAASANGMVTTPAATPACRDIRRTAPARLSRRERVQRHRAPADETDDADGLLAVALPPASRGAPSCGRAATGTRRGCSRSSARR